MPIAGVNIIGSLTVIMPASAKRGAASAACSCAALRRIARRAWPPSGLIAASSAVSKSKSGTQFIIAATVAMPSRSRIVAAVSSASRTARSSGVVVITAPKRVASLRKLSIESARRFSVPAGAMPFTPDETDSSSTALPDAGASITR